MKRLTKFVVALVISTFPLSVWAQGAGTPDLSSGNASAVTGSGSAAQQAALQQQMGMNEAAAKAMAAQKAAAMMNAAVGTALIATGIAGCQGMQTWGCPLIPMGAMALMQAGHTGSMGDLSNMTYDASIPGEGGVQNPTDGNGGGGGSPTGGGGGSSGFTDDDIKNGLDKVAKSGVTVDHKTGDVKTPQGDYKTSDFASPQAMAAAGIGQESISAAQKILDQYGADGGDLMASVSSMGLESGGGGGGGAGGGGYGSDSSSALDEYFASLRNANKGDKDRMIAGKSLTYGSDPIGVKVDNIFMMVHRRYQDKRKVNSYFLEREPASVPAAGARRGGGKL